MKGRVLNEDGKTVCEFDEYNRTAGKNVAVREIGRVLMNTMKKGSRGVIRIRDDKGEDITVTVKRGEPAPEFSREEKQLIANALMAYKKELTGPGADPDLEEYNRIEAGSADELATKIKLDPEYFSPEAPATGGMDR